MLYTLNLFSDIWQLFLNKTVGKKKTTPKIWAPLARIPSAVSQGEPNPGELGQDGF